MIMLDELDCTEDEAYMFAALQVISILSPSAVFRPQVIHSLNYYICVCFACVQVQAEQMANRPEPRVEDANDVDVMLNDLENQLYTTSIVNKDLTQVPELAEYLRYFRYHGI